MDPEISIEGCAFRDQQLFHGLDIATIFCKYLKFIPLDCITTTVSKLLIRKLFFNHFLFVPFSTLWACPIRGTPPPAAVSPHPN
jgi:hypothetical protein